MKENITLEAAGEDIAARIRTSTGRRVYLVGGRVRAKVFPGFGDTLAGADVDIVTGATPEQVVKAVPEAVYTTALFPRAVVQVAGDEIGITTFCGYKPGQKWQFPPPMVADLPEDEGRYLDAYRRDFTINAIYEDTATGEILDPMNGIADLKAGILRSCCDPIDNFTELRSGMLRAIRFACKYNLKIHPSVRAGIRACVHDYACVACEEAEGKCCDLHKGVQTHFAEWEVTSINLLKTLCEGDPARAVRLLRTTGLLRMIAPELSKPAGGWSKLEADLDAHKRGSKEEMLARLTGPCMVHYGSNGKAVLEKLLRRLCLTDDQVQSVHRLVVEHQTAKARA
jgi:tRNA nucleotidyltransferase/poly(A) polymerase